jgi:hypothetical protein
VVAVEHLERVGPTRHAVADQPDGPARPAADAADALQLRERGRLLLQLLRLGRTRGGGRGPPGGDGGRRGWERERDGEGGGDLALGHGEGEIRAAARAARRAGLRLLRREAARAHGAEVEFVSGGGGGGGGVSLSRRGLPLAGSVASGCGGRLLEHSLVGLGNGDGRGGRGGGSTRRRRRPRLTARQGNSWREGVAARAPEDDESNGTGGGGGSAAMRDASLEVGGRATLPWRARLHHHSVALLFPPHRDDFGCIGLYYSRWDMRT